ncbi:hypothetical protein [Mucilaginibacter sp. HD30]
MKENNNEYSFSQKALLGLRKVYSKLFKPVVNNLPNYEMNPDKASDIMYDLLVADGPCMITRFGATEISALVNYLGVKGITEKNIWKFINGEAPEWWWNESLRQQMKNWSGFYPPTNDNLIKFGDLMMDGIKSIDVLGSWQPTENKFLHYFPKAKLINFVYLDPYWSEKPWTRALEGKKVLVVHPFADLIKEQYDTNRAKLFKNKATLPVFDLQVITAVQSIGGTDDFKDWFEALEYLKAEINKRDYDICLIGAGAYGLPLAAHVKHGGKKAVHIGGTLQLLFGVWGNRWDNPGYASPKSQLGRTGAYLELKNEYWVSPGANFRPANYIQVENGCYW